MKQRHKKPEEQTGTETVNTGDKRWHSLRTPSTEVHHQPPDHTIPYLHKHQHMPEGHKRSRGYLQTQLPQPPKQGRSIVASPHFSAVHQRDGFLFSSFKLFRRHYFSLLNRMFVYLRHPARAYASSCIVNVATEVPSIFTRPGPHQRQVHIRAGVVFRQVSIANFCSSLKADISTLLLHIVCPKQ